RAAGHAHAHGSRGLEHPPRERALGAHVFGRSVRHVGEGVGVLVRPSPGDSVESDRGQRTTGADPRPRAQRSTGVSSRPPHWLHEPSETAASGRPATWRPSASTDAVTPEPQVVATGRSRSRPLDSKRCRNSFAGSIVPSGRYSASYGRLTLFG